MLPTTKRAFICAGHLRRVHLRLLESPCSKTPGCYSLARLTRYNPWNRVNLLQKRPGSRRLHAIDPGFQYGLLPLRPGCRRQLHHWHGC